MPRIERLFAWVAMEPDGGEGIAACMVPGLLGITPLIGADKLRVEALRPLAKMIAQESGCPVRLVEFFEMRETGQRIDPEG